MFPSIYCIIDCETTGGSPARNRIIELCLYRYENGNLVEKFTSLVNPDCTLPEFIIGLTGIKPAMLYSAPRFLEISPTVLKLTENATLIAHNARFDRSFLQKELARLGLSRTFPMICTLALSRYLFPGETKHSLDAVASRIGFHFKERHRAEDDVQALVAFIDYLQKKHSAKLSSAIEHIKKSATLPEQLQKSILESLPAQQGLYRFLNAKKECIYIGRSRNIKDRAQSHFSNDLLSKKSALLKKSIADIEFELVKSDLKLAIMEILAIQKMKPRFNQQFKRLAKGVFFTLKKNKRGILSPSFLRTEEVGVRMENIYGPFRTQRMAKGLLENLAKAYELCPNQLVSRAAKGACFQYHLKKCRGVCCEKESAEDYNVRFLQAIQNFRLKPWPYKGEVLLEDEILVDDWCVIQLSGEQNEGFVNGHFNYDIYRLLLQYLQGQKLKIDEIHVA